MAISKINTSSLTDNSVTAGKIVAGAVDADIAAGSIDTAQLANDAVTADKLANAINTTIAAKATNTAVALKAPIASPSFTAKATISIASANGDILDFRSNGSDVGTIGTLGGATYFGSEDSGIMFNGVNQNPTSGGSTRVDNTNDLGAASYRYKNIYLGGGAFIGGTGTANKLDDYETGSWTPVYQGAGGTSGGGYGGQTGTYTKIGQLVHLQAYVNATSKGTLTGSLKIGGFPFTVNPTNQAAAAIGYQIGYNLGSGHNLALWAYSGDFAYLYQAGGSSNSAGLTTGDCDTAIITAFSITYHTNQ